MSCPVVFQIDKYLFQNRSAVTKEEIKRDTLGKVPKILFEM